MVLGPAYKAHSSALCVSPVAWLSLLLSTPTHKTSLFPPWISRCFTKKAHEPGVRISRALVLIMSHSDVFHWLLFRLLSYTTSKMIPLFLLSSLLIEEKRAFPNPKRQIRNTFPRQRTISLWPTSFTIFLYVNIFLDPSNDYAFILIRKIPSGITVPRALTECVPHSSFKEQNSSSLKEMKKKLSVYSKH